MVPPTICPFISNYFCLQMKKKYGFDSSSLAKQLNIFTGNMNLIIIIIIILCEFKGAGNKHNIL